MAALFSLFLAAVLSASPAATPATLFPHAPGMSSPTPQDEPTRPTGG